MTNAFFCKSSKSLKHAFLECPVGLNFFQETLTWFNDKNKMNLNPFYLQLLLKGYNRHKTQHKPCEEIWHPNSTNSEIFLFL